MIEQPPGKIEKYFLRLSDLIRRIFSAYLQGKVIKAIRTFPRLAFFLSLLMLFFLIAEFSFGDFAFWGISANSKQTQTPKIAEVPASADGFSEHVMEELRLEMAETLSFMEEHMPKNSEFLKELEKTCPYYDPSGAAYRGCLGDLLEKKDKKIKSFSDELARDVEIAIAEKKYNFASDLEWTLSGQEQFLAVFPELMKSWWLYRDALCEADNVSTSLGSNHYGFIATCKLYESEKHMTRLIFYRYSWVFSQIDMYKKNNWQINTQAFKDLIEREKDISGGDTSTSTEPTSNR